MGIFGSKPKPQPVTPAPPPPTRSSEEIQSAAESQRTAYQKRAGRASTILTGGRASSGIGMGASLLGTIGE